MPCATEEIWQKLPRSSTLPSSLMVTLYPQRDERFIDEEAEAHMKLLQAVTVAIRNLRATYDVPPSWCVKIELRIPDADKRSVFEQHRAVVENAAKVEMTLVESGEHVPQSAKSIVGADIEVVVPLKGLVDIDAEKKRIEKEIAKVTKEIAFVSKKLGNEKFVSRAPAHVVEKERGRLADEKERKKRLTEALEALE
jgi:valyl-tRNA synthetase